jgi:hypothetical protein
MIACYADRTSLRPGETFGLCASADGGTCSVEIARVGAERQVVFRQDGVAVGDHPTPADAVSAGCGWPVALTVTVGADWRSGYYDIMLTDAAGETAHHFLCVKAARGQTAREVLVLATNTWHAYNYWGGANAYCDVAALMEDRAPLSEAMDGAVGVLSTQRPFAQMLLAPPEGMPRLVNLTKRGFGRRPWAGADSAWSRAHGQSPYDGSAGFLQKWEEAYVRWAEGVEQRRFDYLTDHDLDADPDALAAYDRVVLVGHSEYWSAPQRDRIEQFVDRGGALVILSGNTAFWKVRWDDEGRTLICHKWKGLDAEVPDAEAGTHLWSHPLFQRPEAGITGLSFIFGGYHRLGNCVARGIGGYTVYRPDHWALAGLDLYWGDVIGDNLPLIGYENDGCAITFDDDGLPMAVPRLGVPPELEIIALAPATFAEADSPYAPLIPPEQLDVVAGIAFGDRGPRGQARVLRGHAVMASFDRGDGFVFNGGTTEWAYGLAARDPFVEGITRNVLARPAGRGDR